MRTALADSPHRGHRDLVERVVADLGVDVGGLEARVAHRDSNGERVARRAADYRRRATSPRRPSSDLRSNLTKPRRASECAARLSALASAQVLSSSEKSDTEAGGQRLEHVEDQPLATSKPSRHEAPKCCIGHPVRRSPGTQSRPQPTAPLRSAEVTERCMVLSAQRADLRIRHAREWTSRFATASSLGRSSAIHVAAWVCPEFG